jgi:TP901 family phage tail tape measure protein
MAVTIDYFVRTGQAQAALNQLQNRMMLTSTAISSGARLADTALMAVSASFVAMGAGAFVAYNAVKQFQESLMTVRALGGVTEAQMFDLADSINEVAMQFGVSGEEIAEGAVMLSKAGLTVEQINESIGAMTALSKANGIAFEEAARMTVFAVNTFGKEFSEATQLMDAMQVATQESILDIGDLQKAFAFAGSTAVMSGVSFEQLVSIMAVLSNRALEAGISARSVNKMFLDMIMNTDELQEFMNSMGMTFQIIRDGKLDIDALMQAFAGEQLTLDMLQSASDVFTVRALRSFGLLLGAADEYNVMLANVTNSQGALQEVVAIQMQSFTAMFAKLRQELLAPLRSPEVIEQVGIMVDRFIVMFQTLKPDLLSAVLTGLSGFSDVISSDAFIGALKFMGDALLTIFQAFRFIAEIATGPAGIFLKLAVAFKLAQVALFPLVMLTQQAERSMVQQNIQYDLLKVKMLESSAASHMYAVQLEFQILQTQRVMTATGLLLNAMGSMIGMGMVLGSIDNPMIAFFVLLTSVIQTAITAMMVFNALDAAKMGGPSAPVIFAGMLGLQLATAAAFHASRKEQISEMENNFGVYDSGGMIAGSRHQLVYVEPGETIVPKTQNMLGGGMTVNVGDVYAQDGTDFANKLADALPYALRRVSDRGGI